MIQFFRNSALKISELIDDVSQSFPRFGQPGTFDFAQNPGGTQSQKMTVHNTTGLQNAFGLGSYVL
jgi:hypothetical protein